MTQSQIAQAKFYKNLVNKKTGPLAQALKKDGTVGSSTAAAIQSIIQQAAKDPSGQTLNVDMIPPHELLGIDPKDIKSIQWYQLLGEISVLLDAQVDENKKIQEDLRRRRARYSKRELEYRKHIDELQRELRIRLGYEKNADIKNKHINEKLQSKIIDEI